MRIAGIRFAGARGRRRLVGLIGCVVVIAATLAGCDLPAGSDMSGAAMDVRSQVVAFLQDFARQALAAWLF
jgi:hypothetical protein